MLNNEIKTNTLCIDYLRIIKKLYREADINLNISMVSEICRLSLRNRII